MATKPILTGWLAYILAIVLGVSCSLAPGQGVPRLSATAPAHAIPARVTPPIPTVLQTGQNACTATLEVQIGAQLTQSETIAYLLYLPAAYGQEPAKQWPLILYLHGSGECGRDLDLLKRHPLPALLDQDPDFPFIVVSPQLTACNFSGVSESPADLAALSWAWSARAGA